MSKLTPSPRPLTSFKLLSFDIYGTLIDWESGIHTALLSTPTFSQLPSSHPLRDRATCLAAVEQRERAIQAKCPDAEYKTVLSKVFVQLVLDYDLSANGNVASSSWEFGASVGKWPVFEDTLEAMHRLRKYYKYLVPLSNSSPATFGASLEGPLDNFPFSARYLATEIGSYKPDVRNFEYLVGHVKSEFGVEKEDILHVAQSLYHDHAPARKVGLTGVWIDRKGVMGGSDEAEYAWKFDSLGEFADAVEEAFGKEGKGE